MATEFTRPTAQPQNAPSAYPKTVFPVENKGNFFSTQRGKRFVKFAIIGLIGWGINELFLYLFLLLLDRFFVNDLLFEIWRFDIEKVLIASMASLAIVMVFTFTSNKLWTFKEQEKDVQTKPFVQFLHYPSTNP